MLYLWEAQEAGTERWCFPNPAVLSGALPVGVSGSPRGPGVLSAPAGDSTARDAGVCVVWATYSFSANILEQSHGVPLAAPGPKSVF